MTIKQFNSLNVKDIVHVPEKHRSPASVCASNINRTTKEIKPFLSKKWYSYRFVKKGWSDPVGFCAGMCGPTYIIETLTSTLPK